MAAEKKSTTRQVVVFLDEEEHSLFKQYAVSVSKPMGHIIKELIGPHIEEQRAKNKENENEL